MRGRLLHLVRDQLAVRAAAPEPIDRVVVAEHLAPGHLAGDPERRLARRRGPLDGRSEPLPGGLVQPFVDRGRPGAQISGEALRDAVQHVVLELLRPPIEEMVPASHHGAPGNPGRA